MFALLYILLAGIFGWRLRSILLPGTEFPRRLEAITPELSGIPRVFLTLPLDLLAGLTLTTTIIYFAGWLSRTLFPEEPWFPLALWWGAAFSILGLLLLSLNRKHYTTLRSEPQNVDGESTALKQARPRLLPAIIAASVTFLSLLWALLLTRTTFFQEGSLVHAGVTVFSDLSPHTALTRSFGVGGNIPANYPHFAESGMNYHFFFYFLAGLLNALGLSVEWALNLPSILGTMAFVSALGYFAVLLSRRVSAWPLTFLLFCFRSSLSGFFLLRDHLQEGLSLRAALDALRNAQTYAGPLLHDDWGLYNLNVYANQRHLLWGLAIALYVLLLFLPAFQRGLGFRHFGQSRSWTVPTSQILYPVLLVFPLSYWHGSATIALLLILAFWALFSLEKLRYLAAGLAAVLGALLFRWIFASPSSVPSDGIFQWGYILDDKSLGGVLRFFVILFGVEVAFMLAAFLVKDAGWKKRLAFSFLLPSLFGLTISLTPDVTVNHKYFMMTGLFFLPFVADSLLRLWYLAKRGLPKFALRLATLILLFALTFTGVTDLWAYQNQSTYQVTIQTDDAFSTWIYEHMATSDIAITPPWAMHSYFFTGRQSFYGHSYYAYSAGYDTDTRLNNIRWFLSASALDEIALRAFIEENHLSYLMIDDSWRRNPDYLINEDGLSRLFPVVATFPDQDDLVIYDLR